MEKRKFSKPALIVVIVLIVAAIAVFGGIQIYMPGVVDINTKYYDKAEDAFIDGLASFDRNNFGINESTVSDFATVKIDDYNTVCVFAISDKFMAVQNMKTASGKYQPDSAGSQYRIIDLENYQLEIEFGGFEAKRYDENGKESGKIEMKIAENGAAEGESSFARVVLSDNLELDILL